MGIENHVLSHGWSHQVRVDFANIDEHLQLGHSVDVLPLDEPSLLNRWSVEIPFCKTTSHFLYRSAEIGQQLGLEDVCLVVEKG